jgi:hypothetical protein
MVARMTLSGGSDTPRASEVEGYFVSKVHIDEVSPEMLRTVLHMCAHEATRRGWTLPGGALAEPPKAPLIAAALKAAYEGGMPESPIRERLRDELAALGGVE